MCVSNVCLYSVTNILTLKLSQKGSLVFLNPIDMLPKKELALYLISCTASKHIFP